MTSPRRNEPVTRPPLSEETVNKLLTTQAKDQEIKARELDIRHQELRAQADFAHKMLDAQVSDRVSERSHIKSLQMQRMLAAGGILVLIVSFLVYALHLGHADQVFEFAKILASAIIGAFGGYGYKTIKERQGKDDSEE